jgi:Fe-S cluster biogenesis protein NfuA
LLARCARLGLVVTAPFPEKLVRVCSEVLGPLIRQDGGELYLVEAKADRVVLHLAGHCSGCPGASLTTSSIIEPALRAVAPGVQIVVTSGFRVPSGATPLWTETTTDQSPTTGQPDDGA